jgi:hypothetical protein
VNAELSETKSSQTRTDDELRRKPRCSRSEETPHGDILVHIVPMDSNPFADQPPPGPLSGSGSEQPRKPS